MSQSAKNFSLRHNKPRTFWFSLTVLSLLVLLLVVRLSTPYVIKWATVSWFESQQLQATIIDVDVYLLDGLFIIKGLSVEDDTGKGFSLQHFDISWQWNPLRQHQLVIDKVGVGPLKLDVALYDNGAMNIGGISLPLNSEDAVPAADTAEASEPWDIKLTNLKLSDIEVCVDQYASDNTLAQHACTTLSSLEWSGQLALMASEKTRTDEAAPVYIKGTLDLLSAELCFMQISADDTPALDYCARFNEFAWSGDIALNPPGQAPDDTDQALYLLGSLNINDLVVHNNILDLALLSLESFNLSDIDIKTLDNISIAAVQLSQFRALQRKESTSQSDAQMLAFDQFRIQLLKLTGLNDLVIDTIEITETAAYLQINADGKPDHEPWLPAGTKVSEPGTASAVDETRPVEPFNYSIGRFVFNSQQHFVFYDTSLKVPFKLDIHDIKLSLTGLNSKVPDKASHLTVELLIDQHGKFRLDSDLMPLAEKPTFKGNGEIAGLDLRLVAPMTKQYIGHNIRSGQLDSKMKIDVEKGVINSNMALTLQQFELKALDKKEAKRLDSEFGFPLNSSLSLLRDRDNAIHLDIPVTGDIENPEFDPRDAIVKAMSKAISAAVLHYYTPFGLIFAADALFDLATALKFEPVVFDAGVSVLTDTHTQQLEKLSALLNERPGIHLTLCGLSNSADKTRLFPPVKQAQKPADGQTSEPLPMPEQHLISLQQLAGARSAMIKNQLVEKHSVNASRLIECSPEYVETGISGVEISI